jgi:putative ABC transport system permease protein
MLNDLRIRLRALFRRKRVERELDEELRFHIERQTEKYVQAGMKPGEAARRARIELGGVEQTKEECREARGVNFIETTIRDLRYGLRQLRRSPGFTIVAILTLALGIGANTAVFSVVNGVLLDALPYPQANRLVFLHEHIRQVPLMSISYPNLQDWERQNTVFEPLGAFNTTQFALTGAGEPEELAGMNVSAGFLPALGVKPVLGRLFGKSDDRPGATPAALITYSLWEQKFGGDPQAIGRTLDLNGRSYTLIGILPASFRFPIPADVYVPLGLEADQTRMQQRGEHPGIYAIARLRPGVTIEQARAQMQTIMARLAQQYPATNQDDTAVVEPFQQAYESIVLSAGLPSALWMLLGAVGFVLLIACANVASLLLARGAGREREMAVRAALGAGRSRLARQMLAESMMLAFGGAICGLILATAGMSALKTMISGDVPQGVNFAIDWRVLLFLFAVTVLTGAIFGLAPALHASRASVSESLKEGGRSGTLGAAGSRYRQALVVGEFALGLVLVAASVLMIRSFRDLIDVDPGFRVANILTAEVSLPATKYSKPAQISDFYRDVLRGVRALPGVDAAGAIAPLPLTGHAGWQTSFYVEGTPIPKPGQAALADCHLATPGYFSAMGPPLLRGRLFTQADDASAPHVALVSRSFAERYWPGGNPIGKRIKLGGPDSKEGWTTIVGEVANTKQYGLDEQAKPEFYLPATQSPALSLSSEMTLVVRAAGDASALTSAVRDAVLAVDSQQPISNVRTMRGYFDQNVIGYELSALLLGLFAALGLTLAAVGIYGVVANSVAQRTHEIGIRLALGARSDQLQWMVLGQGLKLSLFGVGAGIIGALGLTRLMSGLLYGVKPTDPLTFFLVSLILVGVAMLACYIPARRAMRVDPAVALRHE